MNLLLIDIKDLKEMLKYVGDNSKDFTTEYGIISKQTIGAIQRELSSLGDQWGDNLFGEPVLDIFDMIKTNKKGMGYINILAADQLFVFHNYTAPFYCGFYLNYSKYCRKPVIWINQKWVFLIKHTFCLIICQWYCSGRFNS